MVSEFIELRAPKSPKTAPKKPKYPDEPDYCWWHNYCWRANAVRPYKMDAPKGGKEREKRGKGLQSPPDTGHHPKTAVEVEVAAAVVAAAVSGTAVIRSG
ncbi:hypothetical protein B5D77_03610 [Microcystis sp. MC19]|nr:hypothetical protein B5D77_03610 [Microcystis sp. MC19]